MQLNWLKLDVNILNDSKIKIIRKYPDGDKIIILWIGLLCLAMKSNDTGYVYITSGIPYTVRDLSVEFDIEEKTVELGLELLRRFNMIDIIGGDIIEIINFEKHQSLDKIEKMKELTAERVRKHRENKKKCVTLPVTPCNVTVTECNATDKIRLDKIRKDKEENKEIADKPAPDKTNNAYKQKTECYNNFLLSQGYNQETINKCIFKIQKELKQLSLLLNKFEGTIDLLAFLKKAESIPFVKDSGYIPSILNSQYSKIEMHQTKPLLTGGSDLF